MKLKELIELAKENPELLEKDLYYKYKYDKAAYVENYEVVYIDSKSQGFWIKESELDGWIEEMGYNTLEEAKVEHDLIESILFISEDI